MVVKSFVILMFGFGGLLALWSLSRSRLWQLVRMKGWTGRRRTNDRSGGDTW